MGLWQRPIRCELDSLRFWIAFVEMTHAIDTKRRTFIIPVMGGGGRLIPTFSLRQTVWCGGVSSGSTLPLLSLCLSSPWLYTALLLVINRHQSRVCDLSKHWERSSVTYRLLAYHWSSDADELIRVGNDLKSLHAEWFISIVIIVFSITFDMPGVKT